MAMDEEALLAHAIAMSMAAESGADEMNTTASPSASSASAASATTPAPASAASSAAAGASASAVDVTAALRDPSFLDELLDGLPGVDKNEIDIDVCHLVTSD
jgi:hypothetical protein